MSNPLQILSDIGPAFQIAGAIAAQFETDVVEFEAGQPVSVPAISTYIAGKHVSIEITVTPVAVVPAPVATQSEATKPAA
jgi:hypothetical protein